MKALKIILMLLCYAHFLNGQVNLVTSGFTSSGANFNSEISTSNALGQIFSQPYSEISGSAGILQVYIEGTTATDYLEELEIKIIPNPAISQISLEGESSLSLSYTIIGQLGNLLSKGKIHKFPHEFDVSVLPSGTYFIVLIEESGYRKAIKFIKL